MTNPGESGLVSFWSMDELSGVRYDKSVVALDLTDNNTVWFSADAKRARSANIQSLFLESLSCPNNIWHNMGGALPFTIGMWIQPRDVDGQGRILAKWTAGSATNSEYMINFAPGATKKLMFYVNNGTTNFSVTADSFGPLTNDVWYFVCVYYDATPGVQRIGIGVNNVYDQVVGPTVIANKTNTLYFGRESVGALYYYDGLVDEAFIYSQRLLTAAERTWMYNSYAGRTYEDVAGIPLPSVAIETGITIGDLPVHIFDTSLEYIGMIEDYHSLNWAERYAEIGDFELEVPIEWETSPLIDFGNFLWIKSSDQLMIIEEKKVSSAGEKTSILITGQSAESLLKRRVLQYNTEIDGPAEINMYWFVTDNLTDPVASERKITLFETGVPEMILPAVWDDALEPQSVYDAVSLMAKVCGFGFKVVCADFTVDSPKLTFYVYEGMDRSYAQTDNVWIIFADKFNNVVDSSFFSSEKGMITIVWLLTEDTSPVFDDFWVYLPGSEPEDLDRIERVLETNLSRDMTDPPMSGTKFYEVVDQRGMNFIKENGPYGLLEGDFDVQFNYKYGEDFFMGDIVQCNLHGQEVGCRVIELVRSYTPEGEKTYLGLDFIML